MTIKELKEIIKDLPDEMEVVIPILNEPEMEYVERAIVQEVECKDEDDIVGKEKCLVIHPDWGITTTGIID